ncbi:MAG: META domain-containing protein, partial [Acidobacteriota bacterium]
MKTSLLTFAIIILGATGVFAKTGDRNGIQWQLTYANGRQVTAGNAYIEIDRSGDRFTGSTGCNRMVGTVDMKGQRIDFGAIGTTKMMCKLIAGSVSETAFLNALEKADRYAQNGNVLYVFDRNGRTVLRFKRPVKLPPVPLPSARVRLEDKKWVLESIKNRKTFA